MVPVRIRLFVAALAAWAEAADAQPHVLVPMYGGRLECPSSGATFVPTVFLPGWAGRSGIGSFESVWTNGVSRFEILAADSKTTLLHGGVRVRRVDANALSVGYAFKAVADSPMEAFCLTAEFPLRYFAGGRAEADGRACEIPRHAPENPIFLTGVFSALRLYDAQGVLRLDLAFSERHPLLLQDSRVWNHDSFSLRVRMSSDGCREIRRDDRYRMDLTFRDAAGLRFDPVAGERIDEGPDWVPMRVRSGIREGSALDFTAMRCTDMPAGRHGYVVSEGDHFEFEGLPGVPQRFYGVNVVGDSNIPEFSDALKFAEHVRRSGYNSVRIHHHESHLVKKDSPGALELDPDAMRRFDGLVYACISNGLYLSTDLYVSRRPISHRSIGIDRPGDLNGQAYKELLMVHEGAVSNFLAWTRAFLCHRNVHTGRRYADEPALAFLSLVNEGNLGNFDMRFMSAYPEFARRWKIWLREKKIQDPGAWSAIPEEFPRTMTDSSPGAAAYSVFVQELDAAFTRRVKAFLRNDLKCRALVTNMNGWHNPIGFARVRALEYDYVDDHCYVDHPEFPFGDWKFPMRLPNVNTVGLGSLGVPTVSARRVFGKPFTITEWNHSAPGRCRGAGGLLFGAAAAAQDWGGAWRFAWSHALAGMTNHMTRAIGNFDVSGDPLMAASERAGVCLFLRRDLEPLSRKLALALPPEDLARPAAENASCRFSATGLGWYVRFGQFVGRPSQAEAEIVVSGVSGYRQGFDFFADRVFPGRVHDLPWPTTAGDGRLQVDRWNGLFCVNTPRTAGGFAEAGSWRSGPLSVILHGSPATVFANSLDGNPFGETRHILVSHLTDVQDAGTRYADRARTILLGFGKMPHLMCRGTAEISLSVGHGSWRVDALATDGSRRFQVPCSFKKGVVSFVADVAFDANDATYLYELTNSSGTNLMGTNPAGCP